jgi:hypothetical protein
MKGTNNMFTTEQLNALVNILDIRLDTLLNNSPSGGYGMEAIYETEFKDLAALTEAVRTARDTQEAEDLEEVLTTVRVRTYQVLTGTTYDVEALDEEEALNRFHDWYGDGSEFEDSVIEEAEALTVVIGHY